jgi:hypothetical protein
LTSKQACVYRNTEQISQQGGSSSVSSISQTQVNDANSQPNFVTPASSSGTSHSGSSIPAYRALNDGTGALSSLQDSCEPTLNSILVVCRAHPSLADDFSNLPLDSLYGFVMDSSESYFGWDIGDTELEYMKTLNSHAPNTPPETLLLTEALEAPIETPRHVNSHAIQVSLSSAPDTRDSQPADSPWVS